MLHVAARSEAAQRLLSTFGSSGDPAVASLRGLWSGPRTVQRLWPLQEHRSTLLFLHGLGGTAESVEDVALWLQPSLPHTKFILPTAPVRPMTSRGGMRMFSWFDSLGEDPDSKLRGPQDEAGLADSLAFIEELINAEVAAGIPSTRVAVGGHSQGGALALAALRLPLPLGGVVALGCWLPLAARPPLLSPANRLTPVLVGHGRHDELVPAELAEHSVALLRGAGASLDFRRYQSLGHQLLQGAALEDVREFLARVLGGPAGRGSG